MCLFAPPLYKVRKIPFKEIANASLNLEIPKEMMEKYTINQQDNSLFRQIRLVTGKSNKFNPYIIFVECSGHNTREQQFSDMILNGFNLNGKHFVVSERSASMTRNSMLSFIDESISEEIDKRISMGLDFSNKTTVLSKYYAYRGLMLSSCHCLEGWIPKIIIIPDYYRVIPNQTIKYIYDKETTFIDKSGKLRDWTQKDIAIGTKDITINCFDGCGIHHPAITEKVKQMLGSKTDPTSILIRAPFLKGVVHEVDYVQFYKDRGIESIKDIWGHEHSVLPDSTPMIIMCESMYKGYKYFNKTNTYADWMEYWSQFNKYNHCIGIAKWNFSIEEEPVYTRANYQILQDLKLPYEQFERLADYSIDWIEKIIDGDMFYTYCFLGLLMDRHKPINEYGKAILKNPEMLKEKGVRDYIVSLIQKHIDELKCGKLFVKGCFKFLCPDLIMLMEHAGGLETNGFLDYDEFYGRDYQGDIIGERIIERNPHICHSEHGILTGIKTSAYTNYFKRLINVCMVNNKSIIAQREQGFDFDGDLCLVIDDDIIKSGIDRDSIVVMDVDDKITAQSDVDNKKNKLAVILRTMKNLIGEYSNFSCAYHNKMPKTEEQRKIYEDYIAIIGVTTGKAVDFAKTGVLFTVPLHISKYGRPLPYFMGYRDPYYKRQKLSKAYSNMNRLCYRIEKWERQFRWKRTYSDFNYNIMIDNTIETDDLIYSQIEQLFIEFHKEMAQLAKEQREIRLEYKDFVLNWDYYYGQYKKKCNSISKDKKMIANIAVHLSYVKYPNKNKKFMWCIASEGILQNLEQQQVLLPARCENGKLTYLGKHYILVKEGKGDIKID